MSWFFVVDVFWFFSFFFLGSDFEYFVRYIHFNSRLYLIAQNADIAASLIRSVPIVVIETVPELV